MAVTKTYFMLMVADMNRGVGFYRVEYDAAQLRALAGRFARLAPADRVTLLSDTFALAQAGRVPRMCRG